MVSAEPAKIPSVSVIFLSYNQEKFVENALRSALVQDLEKFEIIIADDASIDGTWVIIERVIAESIRPGIYIKKIQQPKNLGILGNFNAALGMATGEIFVIMAGDDVSYPSRARKMAEAFASDLTLRAVTCASRLVDAKGEPIATRPPNLRTQTFAHGTSRRDPYAGAPVLGACAAYHRSLLEIFGPLPPDAGGEDVDSIFRALLVGRVQYFGEVLMDYRQHGTNICNYSLETVTDAQLARIEIQACESNAKFDRQWLRDLDLAVKQKFVDQSKERHLRLLIERHVARHALSALSLKVAPFTLWWPAALRLLRRGDIVKVFKLFLLRAFDFKRRSHWNWVKKRKQQR